jgi:anti-sigma factor RsiW
MPLVAAYHDGELPEAQARDFERHLPSCPPCGEELAALRDMSRIFSDEPRHHLSTIGMHRIQQQMNRVASSVVLVRTVRALQAIAAAVLLVASVWFMQMSNGSARVSHPVAEAAPPWVDISFNSNEADSSLASANTPAAAWYLASDVSRADDTP